MTVLNREHIELAIRMLKRNDIYLSVGKGKTYFDMTYILHKNNDGSGFSYCVGGLAYILKGGKTPFSKVMRNLHSDESDAVFVACLVEFFGVTDRQACNILFPPDVLCATIGTDREWAIRMLEKLRDTGVVDWKGTRYASSVTDNCQNTNTTEEEKETNMTYVNDFSSVKLEMYDRGTGHTFKLDVETVLDDTALVSYRYRSTDTKKYSFMINRSLKVIASSKKGLADFVVSVVPEENFTVKRVVVAKDGVVNTVELLRNVSKETAKTRLQTALPTCFAVDTRTKKVYTKETI